jgi:uncharacterized alkaline shock family protein YloU
MSFKSMLTYGTLTIEDVTISDIIVTIMNECKSDMKLVSKVQHYIGRRGVKSGIRLRKDNEELVIDLYVALFSYKSILTLCELIQSRIAKEVEWITAIKVKYVNLHVERLLMKQTPLAWTEHIVGPVDY